MVFSGTKKTGQALAARPRLVGRVFFGLLTTADYFVAAPRNHPQDYGEYPAAAYVIRREGNRVLSVFRLRAVQWQGFRLGGWR